MRPRRLIWQIYPAFLLIFLLALGAVTWYISLSLRDFYLTQTASGLEARARLVEAQVEGRLSPPAVEELDALVRRLGRATDTRITLILPSGRVVGDSHEDPARMESHADRPEIRAALAGRVGRSTRYSYTLEKRMMYLAVPVMREGETAGVVRTALPVTDLDRTLRDIYRQIAVAGIGIALLAALVSLLLSRRITRPLEEIKRGARRFAEGELGDRLSVSGSEEVAALADVLNRMAGQLDERMRTVLRQRNEQEAVLASMVEGVLAVDAEERILRINRAAARLLKVKPREVQGRGIQEVIRKADLQRFVARALASRQPVEGDIVLREDEEIYLQAHGTPLRDARGREIGALVVLNDVTRLRRLENIRRDFVANVSHELKTPITAIKGSAETLRDGAAEEPEAARRFVSIIARQADRLNAIIEDLLALSRIEQGVEQEGIALESSAVRPVLEGAVQACAVSLREKKLKLNLFCSADLTARMNPPLLEQAVINLLTNAIKYSEPEGKIALEANLHQQTVLIRVQDWGCGIEREHLPRLFERFYRVDKARSRAVGGTGLGLAIVKHIVQAHGGKVVVNSTPGEGSVFTVVLPAAE